MKRMVILMAGALAVAACNKDTAGLADSTVDAMLDNAATLGYSADFVASPSLNPLPGLNRLPDSLKLTAEQQAKIKALTDAFQAATHADREALTAIRRQAEEAKKAGKSQADIDAILKQGDPIVARLQAAENKLHDDILAVLTPAQKAWLQSGQTSPCASLSDAQKTQIASLMAAYEQANKADLDAVKAALDKAKAAHEAHQSNDAIRAILDAVKPNLDRLKAANDKLRSDIEAVLTPEQRAAHCVKLPEPPRI